MNSKVKILDCTIRDGGHLNNWRFMPGFANTYLRAMQKQKVDIIEIGYRSTPKSISGAGKWRYSTDNLIRKTLRKSNYRKSQGQKLAVMVDVGKIKLEDFEEKKSSPVDLVRVAFYKRDKEEGIAFAESLKGKGYLVGVNFMKATEYSEKDFKNEAKNLATSNIDLVYFADSFGSISSEIVEKMAKALAACNKPIGFHAHNNLLRAELNIMAAIRAGATYIDTTVYGMGRGAGNMPTELLLLGLQTKTEEKLHLRGLLPFIEKQQKLKPGDGKSSVWGYNIDHFITGLMNIHPNYARFLKESDPPMSLADRYKVLQKVPHGAEYKKEVLEKAIRSCQFQS